MSTPLSDAICCSWDGSLVEKEIYGLSSSVSYNQKNIILYLFSHSINSWVSFHSSYSLTFTLISYVFSQSHGLGYHPVINWDYVIHGQYLKQLSPGSWHIIYASNFILWAGEAHTHRDYTLTKKLYISYRDNRLYKWENTQKPCLLFGYLFMKFKRIGIREDGFIFWWTDLGYLAFCLLSMLLPLMFLIWIMCTPNYR